MTRYTVEIISAYPVDVERLRASVAAVLAAHDCQAGSSVNIQVMDDTEIAQLNRAYRGVDAPTDVLSFPAALPPLPPDSEEAHHLGDLAVAYPYTQRTAEGLGHSLADTLALLVIHGALHLLGYDHDTPANRQAMWKSQAQALAAIGISDEIVPALEAAHE